MVARIGRDGEHDEGRARGEAPDEVEPVVVVGERDVAQDDVGGLALDERAAVATSGAVPTTSTSLEPPDQRGEAVGERRVVLHDREPDHDARF